MPSVPETGTPNLSASIIQTSLGGTNPIKLSEYYSDVLGTKFVDNPDVDVDRFGNHPTTGSPISFGDMYGDTVAIDFVVTSNQVDFNLRNFLVSNGWDENSKPTVIINEGVYLTSSSARNTNGGQTPALKIDGEFPNGVRLVNNGYILGHGGHGAGRDTTDPEFKKGSCAIQIITQVQMEITNNGIIAGGGGGGASSNTASVAKSGGGGGAGGGDGGRGKADSGAPGITHSGNGGAGASTPGTKGADGNGASGDVVGKGGEAGGGGGGYKRAE